MCVVFLRVSFLPRCGGEQPDVRLPQQLRPLSVLVLAARAALPNHRAPGSEAELCLAVGCTVCLPGLSSTRAVLRSTRSTARHRSTKATGVQGHTASSSASRWGDSSSHVGSSHCCQHQGLRYQCLERFWGPDSVLQEPKSHFLQADDKSHSTEGSVEPGSSA